MRIAIAGAGNVGTALSAAAVAAGHDVAVSATTKENAEEAAATAGARAAANNADAVNGAEIVVLALPHAAVAEVGELASSLGYRVIDAGSLRMARSLEEMAFLNITLNATNGWAWQSGWKLVGPTGEQ